MCFLLDYFDEILAPGLSSNFGLAWLASLAVMNDMPPTTYLKLAHKIDVLDKRVWMKENDMRRGTRVCWLTSVPWIQWSRPCHLLIVNISLCRLTQLGSYIGRLCCPPSIGKSIPLNDFWINFTPIVNDVEFIVQRLNFHSDTVLLCQLFEDMMLSPEEKKVLSMRLKHTKKTDANEDNWWLSSRLE